MYICQSKYTNEVIINSEWTPLSLVPFPNSPSTYVDKDKNISFDEKRYRGMIGSLLYLMINRNSIMFSVCLFAFYQSSPTGLHLEAIKRTFRYLKEITNFRL